MPWWKTVVLITVAALWAAGCGGGSVPDGDADPDGDAEPADEEAGDEDGDHCPLKECLPGPFCNGATLILVDSIHYICEWQTCLGESSSCPDGCVDEPYPHCAGEPDGDAPEVEQEETSDLDGDSAPDGDWQPDGDIVDEEESFPDGDTAPDGDSPPDGDFVADGDHQESDETIDGDAIEAEEDIPDGDAIPDGDPTSDGDSVQDGDSQEFDAAGDGDTFEAEEGVDGDTCTDGDQFPDPQLPWISIPGGTYRYGCSPTDTQCREDEEVGNWDDPITIPGFEMTATEITQDQYFTVTGARPSIFADCGGDCPVDSVTWAEARLFCEAVGGRLPHETEWEYAARAGTTTQFYCGKDIACVDDIAWSDMNSWGHPHPVAGLAPNAFGLYDMLGNAWEWCECVIDVNWKCSALLVRGGSWRNYYNELRVSSRVEVPLDYTIRGDGFRCVRDVGRAARDEAVRDAGTNAGTESTTVLGNQPTCLYGDVYRYDSCTERWTKEDECGFCPCRGSTCHVYTHYTVGCFDGDAYWYDCRGARREKKEECGTAECVAGACQVDVPPDFVRMAGGHFTMGSPFTEAGKHLGYGYDHEVLHRVNLTFAFEMAAHEVTQAEFIEFAGNNPSWFGPNADGPDCETTCPVERVNWYDALEYANWQSVRDGLTPCYILEGCTGTIGSGCAADQFLCRPSDQIFECASVTLNGVDRPQECEGYRLPTEAEWEYAARAGTTSAYHNGRDDNGQHLTCEAFHLGEIAWYCGTSQNTTHPVGTKLPNAWGLFDMHGNVWEWMWDKYCEDNTGYGDDPDGSECTSRYYQMIRGGSYDSYATECRSAIRTGLSNSNPRHHDIGFRLARTAPRTVGFSCAGGICADAVTGFEWQQNPMERLTTWEGAVAYCRDLSLGGTGWRLPNISELRTLVRNCPPLELYGACELEDVCERCGIGTPCLSSICDHTQAYCNPTSCAGAEGPSGCFWPDELDGTCGWYWSSSIPEDNRSYAWRLGFDGPGTSLGWKAGLSGLVRCVR